MTEPERHFSFEAVHNFRDLGGYPCGRGRTTRWRVLFRADGLHRLGLSDIDVLRELGIRTVVDLRAVDELEHGRFPLEHYPANWLHVPLMAGVELPAELPAEPDAVEVLSDFYLEMLLTNGHSVAEVFDALGAPDGLPAVFHCAAGKDRTGVMAMLLLEVAGVPDDVIGADYARTAHAMEKIVAYFEASGSLKATIMERPPDVFFECPAAVPERVLGRLREQFGSVEQYLRSVGVTAEILGSIRAAFVQ